MVVYDENSDDASLQYSTSATYTNLWKQPPPKVTGFFVDVFIRKVESKQYNRSCVQDDSLNNSQKWCSYPKTETVRRFAT